jgi:predicted DNA-binding protein
MAVNLRLDQEAEDALRAEAQRTGRSQQDLLREAVGQYLGLIPTQGPANELDELIAAGKVMRPRTPFRNPEPLLTLPAGVTTADLLDRSDRI